MLFEKLLELLAALAVAAGGIAGIGNAAHHADPRADEAALTRAAAHVDDSAAIRIATVMSHTAALLAELEAVGPTDGLARTAEAIAQATENTPDAADEGLQTALDAVTNLHAKDAPAGAAENAPVDVPAGPPADLPGGRP